MATTNDLKNGMTLNLDGQLWGVVDFQHVKPGKGGAFVRTKLRRAADGAVIDRTFRAGEKFRAVRTEARKMQILYADGTDAHFMDEQSYEQLAIPESSIQDPLKWIKPNESVDLLFIDDQPSDIQLSASVELEVTHTEPGVYLPGKGGVRIEDTLVVRAGPGAAELLTTSARDLLVL